MLEARQHSENFWVTLTYAPEHYPEDGSVSKKALQNWLNRLRQRVAPERFRYFAVGEYGEEKGRAHYHAFVFTDGGFDVVFGTRQGVSCIVDSDFHRAWTLGGQSLGFVDVAVAPGASDWSRIGGYVAGYVIKKVTKAEQDDGREPEFMLCSRRPGIGLNGLDGLADALVGRKIGKRWLDMELELTAGMYMVRMDGRLWPLDRVLRTKLYEKLGADTRSEIAKALMQDRRACGVMLFPESDEEYREKAARGAKGLKEYYRRRTL